MILRRGTMLPMLRSRWLPYLAFFLVSFALYAQTLSFGYTFLDDNRLITDNFWFISSLKNVPRIFSHDVFLQKDGAFYRPIMMLSLFPDAVMARTPDNLVPFRFTNILLHSIATGLLFLFLQKLRYARKVSLILCFLFLAHPVLSQAAAWIPGRNDTLLACWLLLSSIGFLEYFRTKKWWWLGIHFASFFLALLTKETAVLFPVAISALAIIWMRKKMSFNWMWLLVMGWLTIVSGWFILRSLVVTHGGFLSSISLSTILQNAPMLLVYLGKVFLPVGQSVLPIVADSSPLVGGIVTILLVVLTWRHAVTGHAVSKVGFGLFWFVVFLLPVVLYHNPAAGLGQDPQLEHRVYLPLIGIVIVVAEFAKNLVVKKFRSYFTVGFVIIFLTFFTATFFFSKNFSNSGIFWKQAADSNPHSPLAHRNLAAMHQIAGDDVFAEVAYRRALELNKTEPMVHGNLGLLAYNRGDLDEAEKLYRREIEINPSFPLVYSNLAHLLSEQGELDEARELWLIAYNLEPQNAVPLISYTKSFEDTDPEKFTELRSQMGSLWSQKDSNL